MVRLVNFGSIVFLLLALSWTTWSQEPRGLREADIEQLLLSAVTQQRVVQVIRERGIDFETTLAVKSRLVKAGAGPAVLNALEKAGEEFSKRSEEAKRLAEVKRQEEKQAVEAASKKREDTARRIEEQAKRKQQEAQQKEMGTKKAEEERRKALEAESRRLAEEKKRRDEEALKLAELSGIKAAEEAKRREEQIKKQDEEKRKSEEDRRIAEIRKQQEIDGGIEEARKRELDQRQQRTIDAMKGKIDQTKPVAHAPPCSVGSTWTFRYEDGSQFTRRIVSREGELCRVGRSYYDKDWLLVKQIGPNNNEVTSPTLDFPLVGKKWMPFPIRVGDEWPVEFRTKPPGSRSAFLFNDFFVVTGFERVDVSEGSFMAFKIKVDRRTRGIWLVRYFWYSPQIEYYVKFRVAPEESHQRYDTGFKNYELLSFKRPGSK